MKIVKLENVNLFTEYKLVYSAHSVTEPIPKTFYVSIPYSNGSIDLTNSMNDEVVYEDVTLQISMGLMKGSFDEETLKTNFKNDWLGRKIERIGINDDILVYSGRLQSIDFQKYPSHLEVLLTFRCHPYRLKNQTTLKTFEISTEASNVVIQNMAMLTVPTITTDQALFIKQGSSQWSVNAGTHKLALILQKGANEITLRNLATGTAQVTFEYQEGAL